MSIKTFELQSKLALHDADNVSIINATMDKWFPYYISNDTGCKIKNIKMMVGSVEFGPAGGTIEVELVHSTVASTLNQSTQVDQGNLGSVRGEWSVLDRIQYEYIGESPANTRVTHRISTAEIFEPSYVVGLLNITGDVKASDLFVWVEYENNLIS